MKYKIFVDGQEGTTGLKIHERLASRDDLEILKIDPDKRKDINERRKLINQSDIVFLCLPDDAAKESVSLIENSKTRVIDASTAHRTAEGWTYGLPELKKEQRELIAKSNRVAVPGCHATGFILLVAPLVEKGILPSDYPVTCCSVSGYSGGGKKLISKFDDGLMKNPNVPKHYSLKLKHKHLPEMKKITGLKYNPVFTPLIGNYEQGIGLTVPLVTRLLNGKLTAMDIHEILSEHYRDQHFVKVMPYDCDELLDEGYFDIAACNNTNRLEIFVFGNEEQILLMSRFDNLGKGASGAAVQNMNIMLGLDESLGLKC